MIKFGSMEKEGLIGAAGDRPDRPRQTLLGRAESNIPAGNLAVLAPSVAGRAPICIGALAILA